MYIGNLLLLAMSIPLIGLFVRVLTVRPSILYSVRNRVAGAGRAPDDRPRVHAQTPLVDLEAGNRRAISRTRTRARLPRCAAERRRAASGSNGSASSHLKR